MYIDFKLLKQKLEVKTTLDYFGITNLKFNNNYFYGSCPIHGGDNLTAFHFNTHKKIFNCFTKCGGGNILDFIVKFKKISVYQAALLALDITGALENNLNFKLSLQHNHQYFKSRNISFETAKYFDMGFCNLGLMKNRIAIPIHDNAGSLVAYAGRAVDNSIPKYLFPHKFHKSAFLFNFHRVADSIHNNSKIFIVEGFFDVFRLYQFNLNALAIMGTILSDNQLRLLKMFNAHYFLMLDGDSAGRLATNRISRIFKAHNISFSLINLDDNVEPDSLDFNFFDNL